MIVIVLDITARIPYSETEKTLVKMGNEIKEATLQITLPQK
jgi:hypothetical protein